jgi:lipopolysaccharide/colanic/teichoic acid biosynthesis glycosyltransferase
MSLVGPRPEVPRYVALYTAEQRRVLQVRPGITDWASIVYRHEEELLAMASDPERVYVQEIMPRKIALNLAYLRKRRGVLSDFAVVMGTLRALLPGAHEDRGLAESADLSTSPLAPESAQGMEAARRQ